MNMGVMAVCTDTYTLFQPDFPTDSTEPLPHKP